jgi:hypothetical protein
MTMLSICVSSIQPIHGTDDYPPFRYRNLERLNAIGYKFGSSCPKTEAAHKRKDIPVFRRNCTLTLFSSCYLLSVAGIIPLNDRMADILIRF